MVDVPKIFDADSKHHAQRYVKGNLLGTLSSGSSTQGVPIETIKFSDLEWLNDV